MKTCLIGLMLTLLGSISLTQPLWAQQANLSRAAIEKDPDYHRPLSVVEKDLAVLARKVLTIDSLAQKVELNMLLTKRLKVVLHRMDSYDYPFDSLKSISRIYPKDNSFRVFTWHIADKWSSSHLYFGLVQRKYFDEKERKKQIAVIQLIDRVDYTPEMELRHLSPTNWMGALYYKPRESEYGVQTFEGKTYRLKGMEAGYKTQKVKYYVLLGWNGHNLKSSYKMIEVITFDPKDPTQIKFGAPIFYFSASPKYRSVFKYSGNASFTLNVAPVVEPGMFGRKKKNMIVFDHLAAPRHTHEQALWEYGPDGTHDAFRFSKRLWEYHKGYFVLERDVLIYDKEMDKYDPKDVEKQVREERKRLEKYNLMQQKALRNQKKESTDKPEPEKKAEN